MDPATQKRPWYTVRNPKDLAKDQGLGMTAAVLLLVVGNGSWLVWKYHYLEAGLLLPCLVWIVFANIQLPASWQAALNHKLAPGVLLVLATFFAVALAALCWPEDMAGVFIGAAAHFHSFELLLRRRTEP